MRKAYKKYKRKYREACLIQIGKGKSKGKGKSNGSEGSQQTEWSQAESTARRTTQQQGRRWRQQGTATQDDCHGCGNPHSNCMCWAGRD